MTERGEQLATDIQVQCLYLSAAEGFWNVSVGGGSVGGGGGGVTEGEREVVDSCKH